VAVTAKTKRREGVDQTLAKVVAHPLRIEALSILSERAASPKELGAALNTPVGNISYHVRELERIGMIELVEEKARRGAVEHFYRAIRRPTLDNGEWEGLSPAEREVISAWIVKLMLTDAVKALRAGTIDSRGDRHLSRTEALIDEQGWEELIEIQEKALRSILASQARCAKRLAKAEEAGTINVVTGLSCFELPPRSSSA
jgi:DNA-binding transcriptional ArsR family regulator